ncbi:MULTISPECIES: ABC-F family ATP-binding cassette domain-containing protein [unclassified Saccharibacter]|uniref:ABC-F family ATP-binding cassette domain-containing protein n=1 Tax=unclassified Saccharibacter TaxID=2648722 RepID=UPI001327D871|nr:MULTISPECIES: ABC-F family ATP-binding cassette domain-containing protein [unclassified Saccharibacter]MXV36236.1 ATP-binding cassette domain-containing protein [Saccharibacter sp. EH611]MXV57096.1 ATP-binding cassette domain-containing protein [Saccharibacter sp. EH70]MXV66544.1 ATP-binding cassette domain-containing protein [Saccharibacter sp. EH60]
MSLLTITDLTLRIAGRPLLEGASLTIEPGRRIGLIGRNGTGKSTLLAAIAGDIAPDSGSITFSSRATMGRVKQETPSGELSLIEAVLASDEERARLLHDVETTEDPTRIADIHERLLAIDAHSAPARASTILAGLGFDQEAQQRPVSDFSGGWRMRVALASALFLAPDLLLLDEPTNHLDIEATLWLEGWLSRFSGAVLVVSHDRSLLDNTVQAIAHLENGRLSLTPGGYDRFVQIRTEQALQQNRAAQKVADQRAKMESFVARFRAKATKARQAQARLKALERLPQIESVVEATPTHFSFPEPGTLPPPMLKLTDVSVGYGERVILSKLSLRMDMDDRIALLGRNGHGKSTFAKLLAGQLAPMGGEFAPANKLRVGYFAQHQNDALILDDSPIDHMSRALPDATPPQVRAQLARFGLDAERAETAVKRLSGGEKARLLLALATRHAPHLLILDEPTNHLDLDARDALIRALCEFEGAVILISHDSHLVESVADRLWIAEKGTITPFDGDMGEYRTWLDERARLAQSEQKGGTRAKAPPKAQQRAQRKEQTRQLAPLRRQIRHAEATLEKLATKKKAIEEKLADPSLYQSGHADDIATLNTQLATIEQDQQDMELLWLDAQDKLEKSID